MSRFGWAACAASFLACGCAPTTNTQITNPNMTVLSQPGAPVLLGATRVDGISARVFQAGDIRYAELDAINSNNAAWNARFTRAGLRAAEVIAGCPAAVRTGTEYDIRPLNSRPFRLAVTQNC